MAPDLFYFIFYLKKMVQVVTLEHLRLHFCLRCCCAVLCRAVLEAATHGLVHAHAWTETDAQTQSAS